MNYNKLKNISKKNSSKRKSLPFSEVKSILFIWNAYQKIEDIDEVKRFANEARNEGIETTFLIFHDLKKLPPNYQSSEIHQIYCKGDFNILGNIKSIELKKLTQKSFDLLINCCFDSHKQIETIVAQSFSKFRIGAFLTNEQNFIYELLVKPSEQNKCENYLKEISKILNKIRTHVA